MTQTAVITQTTVNLASWTAAAAGPDGLIYTDTISATVFLEAPFHINLPTVLKETAPLYDFSTKQGERRDK